MKNSLKKCLVFAAALILVVSGITVSPLTAKADAGPVIITEPADVLVSYPEGATFTVEVENPEDVKSYQWFLYDSEDQEFLLDGVSASTNTLVMPSTERTSDGCYVVCEITDKNDNVAYSRQAEIIIENYFEKKPLVYVESYALEPGDSIDISTLSPDMGSGTVSFSSDGEKITLDNVQFDNTDVIFDHIVSPAIFLMYRAYDSTLDKLTLELKGDNEIVNHLFQESSNGSGIPIDFFCLGESKTAELVIEGDGTLTVEGGTYLIRNNGAVTVNSDLTLKQMGGHFCDGIHAEISRAEYDPEVMDATVTIGEGVKVDADLNGTGFFSSTAVRIKPGADVKIHSSAPTVGAGASAKRVIYTKEVDIESANLDISMELDPERFEPPTLVSGMFAGIAVADGDLNINDSTVNISITAPETGNIGYAFNDVAITVDEGDANITDSEVNINISSSDLMDADGIQVGGALNILDSTVNTSVSATGLVHGLYTRDAINIQDSTVDCEVEAFPVESGDYETEASAHAILSNGQVNISLSDESQYVRGMSNSGLAIGVDYAKGQDDPAGFDPDFEPQSIIIDEKDTVVTPEDFVINRTSRCFYNEAPYIYSETIYDANDHSKPADEVIVKLLKEEETTSEETTSEETTPEETSGGDTTTPAEEPSSTDSPVPPTGDFTSAVPMGVMAFAALAGILIAASRLRKNR